MNIYTKTGDNGTTSLIGGTRVSKADLRLEAYGTADELNSYIGWLRAKQMPEQIESQLDFLQNKLFNLGSYLATEPDKLHYIEDILLAQADVETLEHWIDQIQKDLPVVRSFILPAGNERVALCHVCRTICRRLERCQVRLLTEDPSENDKISLQFVNRMSDYLFVLAKKVAQIDNCEVFLWKKC